MGRYVVGVDFGTLSGRAVVVDVADGAERGSAVHAYRRGVLTDWLPDGPALPPDWALQDPEDHREVLRTAVPAAVRAAGVDPAEVIGIGLDATSCTVLPTLADGTPLAELPELRDRPHAWPKLWKHHAAQRQADRINALAAERGEPWLARYGGRVSAEWQLAKALEVLEDDPAVFRRAERWIETADWLVWQLCGRPTRNVSAAGFKGLRQDGRYPAPDFLAALHPELPDLLPKVDGPLVESGARAGALTAEASGWTGLPAGVAVAAGAIDAHVTAAAARSVEPGRMLAVLGTSTCLIMNSDACHEVPGVCGVVEGGVTARGWGYEAGQSGVGDIFAWYVERALPGSYADEARRRGVSPYELLDALAADQPVGGHGLLALDWHSGNRSVLMDHELSGVLVGLTLATRPEEIWRALLEATAFGARTVVEAFTAAGVPVDELTAAGGLTANRLLLRIYADVLRRPLHVLDAAHPAALGAAIHAAVAAGAYPDVEAASAAMGARHRETWRPDPARAAAYDDLYAEYRALHDHFGRGGTDVLHRLRALRNRAHHTPGAC
ncbi:ribulokinase [Micromonospora sp. 4G57]|uniref:Ribulokinase n=1 Tax=Micromonospora sicca TaxID=2202420 RepID=A0ABU5J706_9ACTN|nr:MULTISPECIES: ribulokinase [unclassified Micromonospora]MDZ5442917.1 ribulokinase [Micromonospora sp. 4G57]MDZ5488372.1 ribulokinase [Micromonospora sp. 4G53]